MAKKEISINKDSIVFYKSFYEAIKELSKEEQAQVYNAIFEHYFYSKNVDLKGVPKAIFALVQPNIDSANKRYQTSVDNGSKGGRKRTQKEPRKNPKGTQKEPEHKPNTNLNDNVNVNDNLDVNKEEDFLDQVIKSWVEVFLLDFRKDGKHQLKRVVFPK
jgi:hypothetical protein